MSNQETPRRDFIRSAGAALTTSIFTGNLKGANDRVRVGYIGIGRMGSANLEISLRNPLIEAAAVCDVYKPHLEDAVAIAEKAGQKPKPVADFREVIADKSIDAVCISTPDHWHAYMTVEACKAGKDVYVEKPLCTYLDEGRKMIEAARKYNRVVQAGTMQRSGTHFQKAVEIVKSGALGTITLCKTWIGGLSKQEGFGSPKDSDPPADLDWEMWLGPAPKRPFNANRWGVHPEMERKPFPYFRYFWDYAGGLMTDWGVHLIDIYQWAFDESMPRSTVALGGKYWVTDNTETPDTLLVTYEYPQGFVGTFETVSGTSKGAPFDYGAGTLFQGTEASLYVSRRFYEIFPEKKSKLEAVQVKPSNRMNDDHWVNFLDCIKSRQKPISDVETCFRTTAACMLGNIAYRSRMRIDWDNEKQTVVQKEARRYLTYEYRKPWKLEV
jgi:predicted dehydrogenase